MKKILLIMLLPLLLCACSTPKENQLDKPVLINPSTEFYLDALISPEDKTIVDLAIAVYTKTQLEEIAAFEGTGTELNKLYPFSCVRSVGEDYYRVSYLGEGCVLSLLIDRESDTVGIGRISTTPYTKDDFFETLKIGQTLDDVMRMDPDDGNEYLFLYTGSGKPLESTHSTKDGYIVCITYSEDYVIENMIFYPI